MLFCMRHGKTEWNDMRKLQGRTDIPLSAEGRAMAREVAESFTLPFDVCYSSPLIRARETAEIFLKNKNTPIYADARLAEMSFGVFEGVENSFEIEGCPINVLFTRPQDYSPVEGGESFEELFARTGEFIEEVITPRLERGERVLIVSHGAALRSIIARYKNIPLSDFWKISVRNCELIRLE